MKMDRDLLIKLPRVSRKQFEFASQVAARAREGEVVDAEAARLAGAFLELADGIKDLADSLGSQMDRDHAQNPSEVWLTDDY
jgi:hypothetical protein